MSITIPIPTPTDFLCRATGKRGFASRHAARLASRKNGQRLRVYVCPACRRWHVTRHERS